MRRPLYKHLPNLGRATLLLFALLAGGTTLIWIKWPRLVRDLDVWLVEVYEGGAERSWNEAREVLSENRDLGIELLVELLEDLAHISKGDRLGPIKRQALDRLTGSLQDRGDYEPGIEWARSWVEFDERDLDGQVRLAEMLYHLDATRAEAIQILATLQARFPEVESVTEVYVEMLIEQGRRTEACQVLIDHLRRGRTPPGSPAGIQRGWNIFWSVGDGFSGENRREILAELAADGTMVLAFDLPPNSRRLRIDPPPYSRFLISQPRVLLSGGGQERVLNLAELTLGLNQMTGDGRVLEVHGDMPDPFFSLPLPSLWADDRLDDRLHVTVRGELAADPPPEAGQGSWVVYWDVGNGFSAAGSQPVPMTLLPGRILELAFDVPPYIKGLRIDPPPRSRFRWLRPQLHVQGVEERDVSLLELPLRLHQMVQYGDALEVPAGASDPYVFWTTPELFAGQQLAVVFEAQLLASAANWMRTVLSLSEMAEVERDLLETEETLTVGKLETLRLQALFRAEIALSWGVSADSLVQGHRVSFGEEVHDGVIRFDLDLPVQAKAAVLRLEFPPVVGSTFSLEALQVFVEGRDRPLDLLGDEVGEQSMLQRRDVELEGARVRIVGGNPHLEVTIPSREVRLRSVRIRGTVR